MKKQVGVMVPLFSLKGDFGIGDLDSLYRLVDTLDHTGIGIIQLLPMNALMGSETSPYSSISGFALHPLYISLRRLRYVQEMPKTLEPASRVNYEGAYSVKYQAFREAYAHFTKHATPTEKQRFSQFVRNQKSWLKDYSLFHALAEHHHKAWWDWPVEHQNPKSASKWGEENADQVEYIAFLQWVLFEQWQDLKSYASEKGIRFMGDLPLYVSKNSADYWSRPEIFKKGVRAGVPPDLYAKEGQDWGNPIYDWDVMKKNKYSWWKDRMIWLKEYFDLMRIDHVRGLYSYWEIPDGKKPIDVKDWTPGPKKAIIEALKSTGIEIIGEDLGDIPPDVEKWMEDIDIAGYRVFLFGWGPYKSEKYRFSEKFPVQSLACTSTHDSESYMEFLESLTEEQVYELGTYLGIKAGTDFTIEDLRIGSLRKLLQSPSRFVIIPLQDITGEAIRINLPGSVGEANWSAVLSMGPREQAQIQVFAKMVSECLTP